MTTIQPSWWLDRKRLTTHLGAPPVVPTVHGCSSHTTSSVPDLKPTSYAHPQTLLAMAYRKYLLFIAQPPIEVGVPPLHVTPFGRGSVLAEL